MNLYYGSFHYLVWFILTIFTPEALLNRLFDFAASNVTLALKVKVLEFKVDHIWKTHIGARWIV